MIYAGLRFKIKKNKYEKNNFLLFFALAPLSIIRPKKDIQKTSFEVNGVCGMCKARIEKTAFSIKGVKTANWDIPTHQFTILFDANKVSLENVHQAIAKLQDTIPLSLQHQMRCMKIFPCVVSMTAKKKKNKKSDPGSLFFFAN